MTSFIVAGALAALLLVPGRLTGQQRDTARTLPDTARPFVRGGVYDKPYQTSLFGRAAFGGYAEAHARWQRADGAREEAGFLAKRFNLFASTRVSDAVRFGAELEFENGTEEIALEYAAIDLLLHPTLALRGGMILSPLGRFNLSHDSPLNELTDRPLVSTELLGVALSEPGFGILGQLTAPGLRQSGRVTYELYATNGFHDGMINDSEESTRIRLGRHNVEDNNASPAFVGRVTWSPSPAHEIGVSAHRGAYNTFNVEGLVVDDPRHLTIAVVDVETSVVGFRVTGEAARATIELPPGLTGIYAARQHGWYLEVGREIGRGFVPALPSSAFGLTGRWDYVDFNAERRGESIGQGTVGVNFRPTAESVLKVDYVNGRSRDEFNNLGRHAWFVLSLATYF